MRGLATAGRLVSDVSRASALWTVSIRERAGQPYAPPVWFGSLVLATPGADCSSRNGRPVRPLIELQRENYTAGVWRGD